MDALLLCCSSCQRKHRSDELGEVTQKWRFTVWVLQNKMHRTAPLALKISRNQKNLKQSGLWPPRTLGETRGAQRVQAAAAMESSAGLGAGSGLFVWV